MKVVPLIALFYGVSFAALAATPEDDYIAARDAAVAKIKKFEAKSPGANADRLNKSALADLEKRLRAIIGDLAVKPYPEKGQISQDSLSENDVGSGGLDALRFIKGDDGPEVYVTTEGLLTRYLKKPEDWWSKTRKTPPTIDEALGNDEFYTYAIGVDAAFTRIADIPIAKPEGATYASARLGGWAQDVGPNPNQEIIVALSKGGKIYIASETAKTYKDIPACEAIWKDAQAKADATYKKYTDGGAKDQKVFDAYNAINDKADKDYHACYSEKTPNAAFFPDLVKEAQAIANRFAK